MQTVKLRNGTEEAPQLVKVLRVMLEGLMGKFPDVLAAYEIAKLAKDPHHKIFSPLQFDTLAVLNLIEGTFEKPQLHDSTRNIVDALIEFDGENPRLVNPFWREEPSIVNEAAKDGV